MTPRVLRTSSFRLAALYAALFVASTGLLFGIVYWVTTNILDNQARQAIEDEIGDLFDTTSPGTPGSLPARVAKEISDRDSQYLYYGLQDRDGKLIVSNLPALPSHLGWQVLTAQPTPQDTSSDPGPPVVLLTRAQDAGDGRILTVAYDMSGITEVQDAIVLAFTWAGAAGLMLALLGGVALSQGFLRRIDELNRAVRGIMAGNLNDRIYLAGSGDELDQLGGNLNAMLDRLQISMESLKQVSTDIAHDLRTPLSRLKQHLDAALVEAQTVAEFRQAVEDALLQANTALATFSALLRIAQIEAAGHRANFGLVDLSALFEHLAATYEAVAEDLGRSLTSRIEPGLSVRGDRELLAQMLVNLIENALRHTPPGSKIDIALRRDGPDLVGEVSDDGPGIPGSEHERVFRRFYRLETSRSTPGNGLGLALVAAIAARHGITVQLEDNRPGLKVLLRFAEAASTEVPPDLPGDRTPARNA